MDIEIDKERLIKIRKSKKLTQAEMALRLNLSLRTYSDYENTSSKRSLSHLDTFRLSVALNVVVSDLWAFIPYSVVLFYSPTRNLSKWAKLLADGKFEDLEVSGLPSEKRLREPLLRLIEVYEDSKKNKESEKLSSSIQRSFDCDDWVHELATQKGETDVPPQIMIMKAPILDTHMQEYPHPDEDSNELIEDYSYRWSFKLYAKIDFTNTNPAKQPIRKDYRNGPDSDVFFSEFDGGYFEYMNDVEIKAANADITKAANHTIDALKARPKIGFQDEYDIENSDDLVKQDDKM